MPIVDGRRPGFKSGMHDSRYIYVTFGISSITMFVIYNFSQILVGKCACTLKSYNGVTEILLFL